MSIINVKQNDRRPVAEATITRGGVVVNLSTVSGVTFKMRPFGSKTLKVDSAAVVTDAVNGVVEYRWAVGDTETPGRYNQEWELLWPDDTTETFPTLPTGIVIIHGDLDS